MKHSQAFYKKSRKTNFHEIPQSIIYQDRFYGSRIRYHYLKCFWYKCLVCASPCRSHLLPDPYYQKPQVSERNPGDQCWGGHPASLQCSAADRLFRRIVQTWIALHEGEMCLLRLTFPSEFAAFPQAAVLAYRRRLHPALLSETARGLQLTKDASSPFAQGCFLTADPFLRLLPCMLCRLTVALAQIRLIIQEGSKPSCETQLLIRELRSNGTSLIVICRQMFTFHHQEFDVEM